MIYALMLAIGLVLGAVLEDPVLALFAGAAVVVVACICEETTAPPAGPDKP